MFYTAFVALVLVLGIVTLFKAVRGGPQGFQWTGERSGACTPTPSPGRCLLAAGGARVRGLAGGSGTPGS